VYVSTYMNLYVYICNVCVYVFVFEDRSNFATRANLQEVQQLEQCPVQLTLYCTAVQYLLLYRHVSIEEQMFRNICSNRVKVSPRSD